MEEGVTGGAVEFLGRRAALYRIQTDTAVGLLGGGTRGGARERLRGPVLAAESLEASEMLEEEPSPVHTGEVPHSSTDSHGAAHVRSHCLALHTSLGKGTVLFWYGFT